MKMFGLSCFLFCLVVTCPVMGQVSQKQLLETDYRLWSTMEVEQLSDYGNWASYSLRYENGNDTLFVKHTKTMKTLIFPEGSNGQFAKEKWFVCQDKENRLILVNLANENKEVQEKVNSYVITLDGRFLIVHRSTKKGELELLIRDLKGKQQEVVSNVVNYSYNSNANALLCNSNKKIILFHLHNDLKKSIINDTIESDYLDIVWQQKGESVAFIFNDKVPKVGYYKLIEKQFYQFDPSQFALFPKDAEVYNASSTNLSISDDGTKVFFGVKSKEEISETGETIGVQIWNTADKCLYPEKSLIKEWAAVSKVGVWFPNNNGFRMVTNNEFPKMMLTGDQEFALLYNPLAYEPQFDRNGPIDINLADIKTGEKKLILKKQSPDENKLSVSVKGRYIAYFRDKDWWVYDIYSDMHRNLTSAIGVSFERENYDWSGEVDTCGIAGWMNDDEALLIYDTYDVWLVKTDGSGYKRLTRGREELIQYRVVPSSESNFHSANYNWTKKGMFEWEKGLLLQALSNSKRGYFRWDRREGLRKLIFCNDRLSAIKMSRSNNAFIYLKEHYHQSPQLIVQFKNSNYQQLLFQSNPQQKKYRWGFSKLISYTNSKGQLLKGALFYPADYNPDKSYPMIVKIYERLSDYYNQYVNPTLLNSTGFNISNFTTKGYFVLLPDIVKQEGNTGKSAVDCVVSTVNEVLTHELVDPKRVGLIGHSFGGYETNYIITQTNIFAAAVSSAGASDVISDYLYVGWNTSKANGFRYEFQQASFGVSPFDDYDRYLRNSPITYAKQIGTPLLLWSGKNDTQVHHFQSLEFHLALRRLQKPNILLLYEGERHTISSRTNQIDLTHRVEEWFAYYLKDGNKPEWFAPDKI